MLRFVVRRLLLLIPILIGLSILLFLWIRALPGSPATALLGERATAGADRGDQRATRSQRSDLGAVLGVRPEPARVRPRRLGHDPPAGHRRVPRALPGHDRAGARGDVLLDRRRDPAGVPGGEALRQLLRPLQPVRVPARDLDPDLRARDHPQVHLRGEARLAPDRGPDQRPDRPRDPDELLRPRRDHRP